MRQGLLSEAQRDCRSVENMSSENILHFYLKTQENLGLEKKTESHSNLGDRSEPYTP